MSHDSVQMDISEAPYICPLPLYIFSKNIVIPSLIPLKRDLSCPLSKGTSHAPFSAPSHQQLTLWTLRQLSPLFAPSSTVWHAGGKNTWLSSELFLGENPPGATPETSTKGQQKYQLTFNLARHMRRSPSGYHYQQSEQPTKIISCIWLLLTPWNER